MKVEAILELPPEELPADTPKFGPRKVIWPDPAKMNFCLTDRRDPFNLAERHTELKRRWDDEQ